MNPCQELKFKKKIITFLVGIIVFALAGTSVFMLGQKVAAKNGNGGFQIKDSYIEVQETSYSEYIPLIKNEGRNI